MLVVGVIRCDSRLTIIHHISPIGVFLFQMVMKFLFGVLQGESVSIQYSSTWQESHDRWFHAVLPAVLPQGASLGLAGHGGRPQASEKMQDPGMKMEIL